MASATGSNSTTARPSSSHKLSSEKPPTPSSSSLVNGSSLRNVNASGIANGHGQQLSHSVRSSTNRLPSSSSSATSVSSRRSVTPKSRNRSPSPSPAFHYNDSEPGRVRVAVRLRPRNAEDLSDADYPDCVELQPELKKLKLRKNNWSADSYRFDEIFGESASQKRVYEVVAKPVVESVLEGYNGTVMAYGQTGTGKTYTLGKLGKDDASERGIMVRALEDIIANTSHTSDTVEVSFLQLYLESIQDLLSPEKTSIPIVEDGKTGEVSVPGATVVKLKHLEHFMQLLQVGEANRHAANTKLNTESSRSHAILMVNIRRSVHDREETDASLNEPDGRTVKPIIRKSKLLIVDLAGSERLDKSGSEGHQIEEAKFINLSLTSLGKCVNALAENSPHIPTRDSKLTRLLRDSFGGSARTSLIVTIGPSSRHHAETSSTILFGQRAMKVVNTMKIKEEFDYESLCRKLEVEIDQLNAELDKQQHWSQNFKLDMEEKLRESQSSFADIEKKLVSRSELLEKENVHLVFEKNELLKELNSQKESISLKDTKIASLEMSLKNSKLLEKENTSLKHELKDVLKELNWQKNNNESMRDEVALLEMRLETKKQHQIEASACQNLLTDTTQMYEKKISDLVKQSEADTEQIKRVEEHLHLLQKELSDHQFSLQQLQLENSRYKKVLAETIQMYEGKITGLKSQVNEENSKLADAEEQLDLSQKEIQKLKDLKEHRPRINDMHQVLEATVDKLESLKSEYKDLQVEKEALCNEVLSLRQELVLEENRRKAAENELVNLKKIVPENEDGFEEKRPYTKDHVARESSSVGQRNTIAKICEEVGLQKILSLLTSGDLDVQIHAVKVVANLAAEDSNQEKIVTEGGLDALLMLLQSSQNTTILRVASGAIANLAMNELNQGLIVSKGGARLLASTAARTHDPQILRMVAGAIANLCGNEALHTMLKEEGAIQALVGMTRFGNIDVIAQVARGLANFAKCESRGILQGNRIGRSPLVEHQVLTWLTTNSSTTSGSARRHIELALCHLAQNENNAMDFVAGGGLKELIRISDESSKDDIRNLAKKTLKLNPLFRAELIA